MCRTARPAVRDRRDGAAVQRRRTRGRHLRRLGPGHRLGPQPARRGGRPGPARLRVVYPAAPVPLRGRGLRRRGPVPPRAPAAAAADQHDPGLGDLRDDAAVRGFIRTHPFVAFRPAAARPDQAAGRRVLLPPKGNSPPTGRPLVDYPLSKASAIRTSRSLLTSASGSGSSTGKCSDPLVEVYAAVSSASRGMTDPLCGR